MIIPRVYPAAWDDFNETIRYLAQEAGGEVALGFEDCVFHHLAEIQRAPMLYRVRKFDIRRVNLRPQFRKFYIAYMIWHDKVIVVAIGHAKRRPFYFRHRINPAKRMF